MPRDARRLTSHARAVRPLATLFLAVALLATQAVALPAPVAADSPPSGEYVPHRVWQMKSNCVWAAGAMLLDKWTHGGTRVTQTTLRRAANKKKGGASLYDLSRGIAGVTGLRLRFSPGYGDTMSWWQLLDRLAHGGGAVLIGDYGRLPAHYTRWDRSFANKRKSSHAVYVQSYDRVQGRVWLMDPLAGGNFPGEWIPVETLHRFASFEHGKVMAAATPAGRRPRTAPLTDHAYRLSGPHLSGSAVAGGTLVVQAGLQIAFGFPNPAAHRFVARWEPILPASPPIPTGPSRAVVDSEPAPGSEAATTPVETVTVSAAVKAGRRGFRVAVPVPATAGRYRLHLGLAEAGRRTLIRTFRTIEVEVVTPYAGTVALPKAGEVTAGSPLSIKVGVANIGTFDWRSDATPTDDPRLEAPTTQTLLVLTWRSRGGTEQPAAQLPIELAPGTTAKLKVDLVAPDQAGTWTLTSDIVNVVRGALSSTGRSLPTMAVLVDPRGLAAEP